VFFCKSGPQLFPSGRAKQNKGNKAIVVFREEYSSAALSGTRPARQQTELDSPIKYVSESKPRLKIIRPILQKQNPNNGGSSGRLSSVENRAAAWGMGSWAPAEPISPYGALMGDPYCAPTMRAPTLRSTNKPCSSFPNCAPTLRPHKARPHRAPTMCAHIARPYG
jgi:hypothetical protein